MASGFNLGGAPVKLTMTNSGVQTHTQRKSQKMSNMMGESSSVRPKTERTMPKAGTYGLRKMRDKHEMTRLLRLICTRLMS
jgi:hypothetical protein